MPRGFGGSSPSNIAHYLKGIDFPATKEELIEYAEDNDAPDEVLDVLEYFPDETYHSMAEVMQGAGQVE